MTQGKIQPPRPGKQGPRTGKQDRLAAALRANLRRRKAAPKPKGAPDG
ncbi:MAG: hypothetical protein OXB87_00605 [Hyphomicrobiales bacterium]|nr:hypothetical protein [Hyphomicrobiales bacterium]